MIKRGPALLILVMCALCSLGCFPGASAATINAKSCSLEDVKAAINSADYTDTVLVPAGNCTWDDTLTITKGIRLQGAGMDNTIIRSDGPAQYDFAVEFSADKTTAAHDYPFVMAGFTIVQVSDMYGALQLANQDVANALTRVQIHDNRFTGTRSSTTHIGIGQEIGVFGVIYNNIFQDMTHSWRFLGSAAGWTQVEGWVPGTANAMYYEDNYAFLSDDFNSALIVSGGGGNRYVARYNTFNLSVRGSSVFSQAFDIHGNQDNNPSAGIGLEIYGNQRIGTNGRWLDQRGGKVFFFYNRWMDTGGTGILNVWEEYNDDEYSPVEWQEGSPYEKTASGHILQRAHDSYYWANYGGMNGNQLSSSLNILYDHYNRVEGIINDPLTLFENDAWFRENTMAFDGTIAPVGSCGYYEGPQCTRSGIGCGTLAEMNSITPTAKGLGFWVTGQSCDDLAGMAGKGPATPISGTLYRAEDDGQGGYEWVKYYTPYIYPHPLRSAPSGAEICGEGEITQECWCEGAMRTSGDCIHGYYSSGSQCSDADTDSSGDISITELTDYISQWKAGSVIMADLMTAISEWKNGCA